MEAPIDLQDWELLSDSDPPVPNIKPLDPIDHDSEDGAIKSDYFPLKHIELKPQQQQSTDEADFGSIDSDNPSWLDPDSDSRYQSRGQLDLSVKNSASFWSDASSEGPRLVADESEEKEEEVGGDEVVKGESLEEGLGSGGGGERVWWRMPLEILKVWILRARPVWSISIAVAIVGVVILGKRLHKMKQKGRSIQLKTALDDKKASQFMARAARLNEAFSVMKRVPIIRPSLPAGGVTSWPMAVLR